MTWGVNDYPFRNAACGGSGVCGYSARQCTSFAMWRITNDLGHACIGNLHDAQYWAANARAQGFSVDGNVRLHDVVVWGANVPPAGKWGHVAMVLQVLSPTRFIAEQYNYGGNGECCCYTNNVAFSTAGAQFIHIESGPPPPPPPPPHPAPLAVTGAATGITARSAFINGMANDSGFAAAGGGATSCDFNFGTTPALGTPVPASNPAFTNYDNGERGYLHDLTPGTTYYFQIATWNAWGTTYGAVSSFTTLPSCPGGCPAGTSCVNDVCACPGGTGWNGATCAPLGGPPPSPSGSMWPTAILLGAAGLGYYEAQRHRSATSRILHDPAAFGARRDHLGLPDLSRFRAQPPRGRITRATGFGASSGSTRSGTSGFGG